MGYPYDDKPNVVHLKDFVCEKCGREFSATSAEYWKTTADDVKSHPGAVAKKECIVCGGMGYSFPPKRNVKPWWAEFVN